MAFLGSPWVTDLQSLLWLGLSLDAFALHDPVCDYLLLLQAQKLSIAESGRLTRELGALNAELEARVRAVHQPHLADEIVAQALAKHLTPEQLRERLELVKSLWGDLSRKLAAQLIPAAELQRMLRAAVEIERGADEVGPFHWRVVEAVFEWPRIKQQRRFVDHDPLRRAAAIVVAKHHVATAQHMQKTASRLGIEMRHATQRASVEQVGMNPELRQQTRQAIECTALRRYHGPRC